MAEEEPPEDQLDQEQDGTGEDDSTGEVQQLMEDWGAGGGRRKRKGRAVASHDYAAHPGFMYAPMARLQHVSNLVACMRHYASIREDVALAHVLGTLLQVQNPASLSMMWQYRHKGTHARMAEVLLTGYDLLRRHPSAASFDSLKRYLRRARQFQLAPAGKDAVTMALARLMLAEGHLAEAYDELSSAAQAEGLEDGGRGGGAYERADLLGSIRHRQWSETMQEAADRSAGRRGGSSQASQSQVSSQFSQSQPGSQLSQGDAAAYPWDGYSHNAAVAARAGRAAQELAQSAAQHLSRALELCPGATPQAMKLVQLALAQRQRKDALRVARAQSRQAPHDANAHATCLLLLFSEPSLGGAAAAEAAERAACLLNCDPSCGAAAQVLVELSAEHADLVATPVLKGLCTFLDTCPPTLDPTGLALRAWQVVGSMLRTLAASVRSLQVALCDAKAKLRRVQQQPAAADSVEAAALELRSAHGAVEAVVAEWQAAGRLLRCREWWTGSHLALPVTEHEAALALQRSSEAAAALAALALVHAAQHAACEGERLAALGEWRPAAAVPAPAAAPCIAAALRRHGAAALADQLDSGVQQIDSAHAVVLQLRQGPAHAAACLASAAAAAATFATEAGCEWAPPEGWKPIPIGSTHPELGPILPLPAPWWLAFPVVRRGQAQQARLEAEQREAETAALLHAVPSALPGGTSPPVAQQAAAGAGDAEGPTPMEMLGSQPTQRAQRRVRFQVPE